MECLVPGEVCLHDEAPDDNFITLREINLHCGGVHVDEVQQEDEVGTVLDLEDLQLVGEGVQP